MRTNSNNWIEKSKARQGQCGWRVLSEFLTVIITHSQAQLSTCGSHPYKIQQSLLFCFFFFFFFCHDLVWPLRDVLSFAILDRGFYGALYFFALQQQIKPFRQKEWLTVESLYSWQPIDCWQETVYNESFSLLNLQGEAESCNRT